MILDLSKVVPIFQSAIDAVLAQMGKPCLVVFEDTISNTTANFEDTVNQNELKKPNFKADSISDQPVITKNSIIITALTNHSPKEFKTFNINVREGADILRLKTLLTDAPSLIRAKYVIPNYDSLATIGYKYRLVRNPVPRGLQVDRYAVSYWERIG